MAQWALFGVVAAFGGFVAFVLAALGLVVGAALVGIFSVSAALLSRRRAGGASAYAGDAAPDGRETEGDCVELGRDAYTVRIVEGKKSSASAHDEA
jgi:hypothetical protein